jgi:hypothetical protein
MRHAAITLKAKISIGFGFTLLFILWGIPLILLVADIQPYDFLTKGLGLNLDHIKEIDNG